MPTPAMSFEDAIILGGSRLTQEAARTVLALEGQPIEEAIDALPKLPGVEWVTVQAFGKWTVYMMPVEMFDDARTREELVGECARRWFLYCAKQRQREMDSL